MLQAHDVVISRQDVLEAVVGSGMVLVDPVGGRAFLLDTASALIWTSLVEPTSLDDVVADLVEDVGGDPEDVRTRVIEVIGGFDAAELLAKPDDEPAHTAPIPDLASSRARWNGCMRRLLDDQALVELPHPVEVSGTSMRIRAGSESAGDAVQRTFSSLPPSSVAEHEIVVLDRGRPHMRRYRLYVNGEPLRWSPLLDQIASMAAFEVNQLARAGAHGQIVLHAGAVERDGRVVVIAGESGRGKSTLTAFLVQQGYRYVTDEVVVIDPETGWVTPYPKAFDLGNASLDRLGIPSPDPTADQKVSVDPRQLGDLSPGGQAALVAFLDEAGSVPDRWTAETRALHMIANAFSESIEDSAGLGRLVDWSGAIPTVRVPRAALPDMRTTIESHLANDPPQDARGS